MALFLISIAHCLSQQMVEGIVVEDLSGEPIPFVNILIKNGEGNLINFSTTDDNGNYSIRISKDLDSLFIETSIISHLAKSKILLVDKIQKNKVYTVNFKLSQRLTELDEIYIESDKRPITVKKDTTVYNINQFKDGSESVVEDLLKKLPGISVGDNGIIKFKGKQVVRVLLDNDNIFDSNYTIGTKNIDSEIIEGVQAIEDYNVNPLLKDIKTSEDVAINLILKKGKTDLSGNTQIGFGLKDKALLKVNTISVSKKLKGFSTLSYNNIGENYSPYNFTSNAFEMSKINELEQRTTNLVNSSGFNSNLPNNRISVNNNFFGSINALYKINRKVSFKLNYNLFKDKLTRNELYNTIYTFNNEALSISNKEDISKKPLINTFGYDLIYNINKNSLLTSTGKLDSQTINKTSTGFNNSNFENITKSKDVFVKNNIEYTYRINDKKVLQFFGGFSTNNIPQNVDILFESNELKQAIDFKKNYFKLQSKILSKTNKSEYEIALGYNFNENFIDSELIGINNSNQYLTNNMFYKSANLFTNFIFQYKIKKWQFIAKFNNSTLNIKLNDLNTLANYNENFFTIQPTFSINYYLNKTSHFYSTYSLTNQLPEVHKIYSGLILTNNRTFFNNNFKFNLFNKNSVSLGYRINDFYNLFQFNTSATYSFRKYGYINQFNVTENTDFYTSIVSSTNNKNLSFNVDFEKYIHFLKSTININSSYTILNYQNIINNSQLRDNTNKNLLGQVYIRTGFQSHLNFENKIMFSNNNYSNNYNSSSSFSSFQNDFKIKYLKDDFQFTINSQFFKPDLNQNISGDLFLDVNLSYSPKNSKIEYLLKANNLLNKKIYRNINISDFSTSIFQHNLQKRFILFSIQFKY